jgi:hypothetical protein
LSQYKELLANEYYPVYSDIWHKKNFRGLAYRGFRSLLWNWRALRKRRADAA